MIARPVPQDPSALDAVPPDLPPLERAWAISELAAGVGFDWSSAEPVFAKLSEEIAELRGAMALKDASGIRHELGDLLLVLVNLCRHLEVDPRPALLGACARFDARFRLMERMAEVDGSALPALDLEGLEALWKRAKAALQASESSASATE